MGFPIRKSAGLWIFAPNRSLSQLVTSFVGSWCQVILPTLFLTWPVKTFGSRKLYKNKRNSFLKLKFYPKYLYFGKTFPHMICIHLSISTLVCGVCDILCLFLIYLLSIIFLILHYLVFKVHPEYVFCTRHYFVFCLALYSSWGPRKALAFWGNGRTRRRFCKFALSGFAF